MGSIIFFYAATLQKSVIAENFFCVSTALAVQPAFCFQSCRTARTGCDNGLSEFRRFNVSGGKNSGNAGFTAVGFGDNVAAVVQFQVIFEDFGIGVVSDGDEDTVYFQLFGAVIFDVFQLQSGNGFGGVRTENFFDNAVPFNSDFGVVKKALLHGFVRS